MIGDPRTPPRSPSPGVNTHRHGHTFWGSNVPSTPPSDFLREYGGLIPDISTTLRTSLNNGRTFVSSSSSPRGRGTQELFLEPGGRVTRSLSEILRPGLAHGRLTWSSRSREASPHDHLQEYGGFINDLSDITRPNLKYGQSVVYTSVQEKQPHDHLQEYGGHVRDLSDITRTNLRQGRFLMSSTAPAALPHDHLHEYGGFVEDLRDITRPNLRHGSTYTPSSGKLPLGQAYLEEYGGHVRDVRDILRPSLSRDCPGGQLPRSETPRRPRSPHGTSAALPCRSPAVALDAGLQSGRRGAAQEAASPRRYVVAPPPARPAAAVGGFRGASAAIASGRRSNSRPSTAGSSRPSGPFVLVCESPAASSRRLPSSPPTQYRSPSSPPALQAFPASPVRSRPAAQYPPATPVPPPGSPPSRRARPRSSSGVREGVVTGYRRPTGSVSAAHHRPMTWSRRHQILESAILAYCSRINAQVELPPSQQPKHLMAAT